MSRPIMLTLFGATGFCGRQLAALLDEHAPADWQLAIAGRNLKKLNALKAELSDRVHVAVCDAFDDEGLAELAASSKVVLSTAGPFAQYGTKLFNACVEAKTHYADITGETPWVKDLIDRHHVHAVEDGTRLVPFAGFDSVPGDVVTFVAAQALAEKTDAPVVDVHAAYEMQGGLNGGTAQSMAGMLRAGEMDRLSDPLLLCPDDFNTDDVRRHTDDDLVHSFKRDGRWHAPWMMGPVNTRVVRRGHALSVVEDRTQGPLRAGRGYGPNFNYQESFLVGKGLKAAVAAKSIAASTRAMNVGALQKLLPSLIDTFGPKAGEGPSQKTIDTGFARVTATAKADDGTEVKVRYEADGDPSNTITVQLLAAVGLCLAHDEGRGDDERGGILPPVLACGEALVERLRGFGQRIDVVD